MTDGEKALGVLIALMGASMGAHHVRQYGQKPDDSVEHVLGDKDVREILELDE